MDTNITGNSTNVSQSGDLDGGGNIEFSYFSLAIILVILVPIVSLNLVLVVILIREKTIPVSVRFLLSNILAACTVVAVGLFTLFMSDVVLSACQCGGFHGRVHVLLCRICYSQNGCTECEFYPGCSVCNHHMGVNNCGEQCHSCPRGPSDNYP